MNGNLRLLALNDADAAALSASPAALPSLPVGNLQNQSRALLMRSNGVTSGQEIAGVWPSARVISCCVLDRHNLTSQATWRLQLFEDAGATLPAYDSGTVNAVLGLGWGEFVWGLDPWGASVFNGWPVAFSELWFEPVACRAFKLTLNDPGNTAGYLEAARLLLGFHYSPQFNASFGLAAGWLDKSEQILTDGGSLRTDPGPQARSFSLTLEAVPAAERGRLFDLLRRVGLGKDLWLSIYPEQGGAYRRDHAARVKLTALSPFRHARPAEWATELAFQEC